ncbi:CheR family methyltransferase [Plastorhodobacter daqingensis]|uniref:Chemotaxis protein methyltransferase n=1 Tax=Plastorhodobacter daqingensis TaxID=1387281 RepID=A0ABW2UMD7_9RHOB
MTIAAGAQPAIALSADEFRRLAKLVYSESGIVLPDSKKPLVISRLSKRLRTLGMQSFAQYLALVESGQGGDERGCMISSLTTNVTRFMREEHHFQRLRTVALPPLIERARRGGRLRIWSAGCSTGEEPYSLAFTLLDMWPEAAKFDVKILATDIDPQVIATATAGQYSEQALEPLPAATRQRYLRPVATRTGYYEVTDVAKGIITFKVLNLLAQWPFQGPFDIIFCRNVVIYLDAETKDVLWRRYAQLLAPGGHLFIGHSERISASAVPYFHSEGVTSYVRTEAPVRDAQPLHQR